jgi:hypothetical protein
MAAFNSHAFGPEILINRSLWESLTFPIGVKQAGLAVTPRLRTIARLLSSFDELDCMWLYRSGFRYRGG